MTNHPLTDDLAEDIASTEFEFPFGIGETVFTYNDMRRAADWQLEQVIEFLENCPDYEMPRITMPWLIRKLKKAMRPQEES